MGLHVARRLRRPLLCAVGGLSACIRWGVSADDDEWITSGSEVSTWTTTDASTTAVETSSTGDVAPDWPDAWPIDPRARVVVWGRTGIPTRNLRLFENFIVALADGGGGETGSSDGTDGSTGTTSGSTGGTGTTSEGTSTTGGTEETDTSGDDGDSSTSSGATETGGDEPEPGAGALSILWIGDCDPRVDELGCLAGNIAPFFEMIDRVGRVDFRPLSAVDARAYDVVVADFCGPVDPQQVATLLGDGAGVLVLGDRWCGSSAGLSADVANVLLERIGARFTATQLYNHDLRVPAAVDSPLVAGVETIDAWGVTLQETRPDFQAILVTTGGAVITAHD
jgi:hypothetical protein